ncbi:MAG: ATP-dependent DNA helicase RecG [Thermaerobacterales bacterium]
MAALLDRPVGKLKGVGPARARQLERLGITRVGHLLEHFPHRHDEPGAEVSLVEAAQGSGRLVRVQGRLLDISEARPRRGLHLIRALLQDHSGAMMVVWFNQPYLARRLQRGGQLSLTGRVERRQGRPQLVNPEIHDDRDGTAGEPSFLPVYPTTAGLHQRGLRSLIRRALDAGLSHLSDIVPPAVRTRNDLPDRDWAVRTLHYPASAGELQEARRGLAFEELFVLQTALTLLRRDLVEVSDGYRHRPPAGELDRFYGGLPFDPTPAQQRVIEEILTDMAAARPMHRLVQGDVGSGKTLVAAVALLAAAASGSQGTMMAPTEILAAQHYETLKQFLAPMGVRIALLVGSMKRIDRAPVLDGVAAGEIQAVVGTHALLEENVQFDRLGLVVTDEQHRFGVQQRARLQSKGGSPDVLVMTATPIPRTLALTLYGDLDVSVIDELPPGRVPPATRWLPTGRRAEAYGELRRQLREGRQVYVVCPLIDESAAVDMKAATDLHVRLQRHLPPEAVGLLHGRLPGAEKQSVLAAFRDGRIKVLVTTTVIEVGIDVSNATLMIVEDAERFGLAQLHQLRGRVGRGSRPGLCVLLADPMTEEGRERMRAMEASSDGFYIAERDLELRGPGEFFGTRQHGLPDLRIANPVRDVDLLQSAREEARRLVYEDPLLEKVQHAHLRAIVLDRYGEQVSLALVG